jgi:hypothetical protein
MLFERWLPLLMVQRTQKIPERPRVDAGDASLLRWKAGSKRKSRATSYPRLADWTGMLWFPLRSAGHERPMYTE